MREKSVPRNHRPPHRPQTSDAFGIPDFGAIREASAPNRTKAAAEVGPQGLHYIKVAVRGIFALAACEYDEVHQSGTTSCALSLCLSLPLSW